MQIDRQEGKEEGLKKGGLYLNEKPKKKKS